VPGTLRLAAAIVTGEALALAAGALTLLLKTLFGNPDAIGRALALIGFALVTALVLGLCARGLIHLRPSARSPIVIVQLLALPVTYSLGFQAGRSVVAVPIMLAAVLVLGLLLSPSARQALDRVS